MNAFDHLSPDLKRNAEILWDYLKMPEDTGECDLILVIGSHDLRVAKHAAKIILEGISKIVVISGGFGKVTVSLWNMTEAEKFAEVIAAEEVSHPTVFLEKEATNTGDNFVKTRHLLDDKGLHVRTGLIITKPYMARRAFATGSRQWGEVAWRVSYPTIAFDDYPTEETPLRRMICLMVGDLQRIAIYPKSGFQTPQEIPSLVWDAFYALVEAGYDEFVIRDASNQIACT